MAHIENECLIFAGDGFRFEFFDKRSTLFRDCSNALAPGETIAGALFQKAL
jgi:hypothetical protein